MDNISIREYKENDFQAVVNFMIDLQNYFVELDQSKEKKPFSNRKAAEDYIKQAIKDVKAMNGGMYVAKYNNEIAGFIQGVIVRHKNDVLHNLTHRKGIEGWIGLLFTEPKFRGKGIGKNLIDAMKKHFKKHNCTSMRLRVASNNEMAINVYTKYSFVPKDLEMAIKI